MTPLINNLTAPAEVRLSDRPSESTPGDDDTELIGSRIGRIDPDNFRNQHGNSLEDDEDKIDGSTEDTAPNDEDGGSTDVSHHGEHDHQ